ncbi:FmdE family protein [Desulfocurvus sp. DL9XJH121]
MNPRTHCTEDIFLSDCIGNETFDEFVERARRFHGYPAPGLLLGGFMVEAAKARLPKGILFDAISETPWCLPDAVQMLTPCTVGNGWLKVLNLGLYAVTLYDKSNGVGVRVSVDYELLCNYPEYRVWLMKEKPKREQDDVQLRQDIRTAGASICRVEPVLVHIPKVARKSKGAIAVCPLCGQPYPKIHGRICRLCQGETPYENNSRQEFLDGPQNLKAVAVTDAEGRTALHDMTRIVPGEDKGPAFTRGQVITGGDICRLQSMGRNRVYVEDGQEIPPGWVHEDAAAQAFADALCGGGVAIAGDIREGKANLVATRDGLLTVDTEALTAFNSLTGVIATTRHDGSVLKAGTRVAATRSIPLFLPENVFHKAVNVLGDKPVLHVRPMRKARAGILITGTEVFQGLIEDKFEPVITGKLKALDCEVLRTIVAPDDREAVSRGIRALLDEGCDLIVTTAGLSVDPDDVTRQAIMDAGAEDLVHGAPILPGAMTLTARIGTAQILGVPACALFYKTTSLDLILPRLLAGQTLDRKLLSALGHGGLCMECKTCTFPKCPFGK